MSTDQVESLWDRLEPLLSRVQKPARYIGCEDGAQTPDWAPVGGRSPVSWLFIYPDTYEIGLPNQGLQILYEIVNERPDARGRAVLRTVGRPRGGAAGHRHPAVQRRHPPSRGRLRPARLQPVGRAHVHQPPELRGPGRRAGPGRPSDRPIIRWSAPGVTAPTTPSPWPTSSTSWCSETARRSCRRSRPSWADWKASGGANVGRTCSASCAASRASTSRRRTRSSYDGADLVVGRATLARGARSGSRSGPSRTSPSGRTPASNSSRSPRWCTTA